MSSFVISNVIEMERTFRKVHKSCVQLDDFSEYEPTHYRETEPWSTPQARVMAALATIHFQVN